MKAREIIGKEVVGDQGWRMGKVKDVMIDLTGWQVKAFEVDLAGNVAEELGMKRTFRSVQVPVSVEDIRGVGDFVTLKISKEQLKGTIETGQKAEAKAEVEVPQATA